MIFILVGIIDSGLGGISVVNQLIKEHKYNDYILFLDYKYNPFGLKKDDILYKRLLTIIAFLRKRKCKDIIIACNTLSIVALKYHIKDVIIPLLFFKEKLVKYYDNKSLLLATNYTIDSKYYLFKGRYSSDLVSYIEGNGSLKLDMLINELSKYQKLFLGCTHFNLLSYKFKNKIIYDSGKELANNYNLNSNILSVNIYVSKINHNIYNHLIRHIHLSKFNIFLINN